MIGAMVIAPLLKPNMALAVATTMGDTSFTIRTLWTGLVGILIALGFSVVKAEKVTETAYGIWIGLLIGLVGVVMVSRLCKFPKNTPKGGISRVSTASCPSKAIAERVFEKSVSG